MLTVIMIRSSKLLSSVGATPPGQRLGARLAQGVGLRFASALCHRLGEIREEHREPEPDRDLQGEADRLLDVISEAKAKRTRDDFFPRASVEPDKIVGLDTIVKERGRIDIVD